MKKSAVLSLLHTTIINIEFVKKDDTIRKMKATLAEDFMPLADEKEGRKHNPEVQPVWDVEAQGFRSFRWDSLQAVNGETYLGE